MGARGVVAQLGERVVRNDEVRGSIPRGSTIPNPNGRAPFHEAPMTDAADGHDHGSGANARALAWALALTGTFLVVEVVGSFVFNSLALLSDAAHMLTDVAALAIALAAIRVGARPADDRRTFGYRRFEVLAAAFNAILLFAVAIYVLVEAVRRFREPVEVGSVGMLVVAAAGLAINLVSMRILRAGQERSLNVKGAYLEVWADMIGSVGVILGAVAIRVTGWTWVDPAVAVLIAVWVLPRTWVLLRDTSNVLLEGVPAGISLPELRAAVAAAPGVAGVHDLHVWATTPEEISASAHVVLAPGAEPDAARKGVAALLADRYGIAHSTIQTERAGDACQDAAIRHL